MTATALQAVERSSATEVERRLSIGVFGIRGIPSTYSGYETFMTVMLPELAMRGHDVTVYCRSGPRRQPPYRKVSRVGLPSISTKQLDTLTHGAVASAYAGRSHDVLLVCNVANAVFLELARPWRAPVVLNVDGQEWLRHKWSAAGRSLFRRLAGRAGRSANALVTDCVAMQSLYEREFGSPSTVIPYCWTGLIEGADRPMLEASVRAHGLEPSDYVLCGGRLVPENNIERIVDSFVRSDRTETLVILGEANYRSETARHVLDAQSGDPRIRFLGHVHDRRLFGALLACAGAYVHGHSVGGINPSLVEAMGCGAAVLAYDTPFNREALGDAGRYFSRFGEPFVEELSQVIDGDGTISMRSSARARCLDVFDGDAVTDAYEAMLQQVVVAGRSEYGQAMPTRWSQVHADGGVLDKSR